MRRTWAVVRLTIAESIRTRVAIAFMLLLIGVMVLLISTATGDGTVRGKIQMFMSYSMGMTYFLLALLVTFLACRTLDQDIKTQRIDSLVCKPLARWQLLLGRWLGIVLMAGVLFSMAMGLTYGMVRWYARSAKPNTEDKFKLDNQVLVARRGYLPPAPDFTAQVAKRIEDLKRQNDMPAGKRESEVERMVRDELVRQSRTVNPRQQGSWTIRGLPQPQKGEILLTLRYKYEPSVNTSLDRDNRLRSNTIYGQWIIGRKESKQAYITRPEEKPYRVLHELNVPINAIEPDGSLTVTFVNGDPRAVAVHFPVEDGLEVLVYEGTFGPNFVRTAVIVFAALVFLTTLALTCGTFLSFPIASLVTLSCFFIGLAGNFLYEAIGIQYGLAAKDAIEYAEKVITLLAVWLVPMLDVSTFTGKMIDGRIVDWTDVGRQIGTLVVIKTGILAILAGVIFHRRELGKVTV